MTGEEDHLMFMTENQYKRDMSTAYIYGGLWGVLIFITFIAGSVVLYTKPWLAP